MGFSTDLKTLLRLGGGLGERYGEKAAVVAPWSGDPELQKEMELLRAASRRVLTLLPGQQGGAADMGCSEILARREHGWVLEPIE